MFGNSSSDTKVRTLMTGLSMGESPRWHEDRLWLSDWGAQEILAIDFHGKGHVQVRVPFAFPFCMDWRLDGTLLIVSGREGLVMRRTRDGSLVTHADLRGFSDRAGTRSLLTVAAMPISMAGPESHCLPLPALYTWWQIASLSRTVWP
jgi:sugar lactone lactonase YvrE